MTQHSQRKKALTVFLYIVLFVLGGLAGFLLDEVRHSSSEQITKPGGSWAQDPALVVESRLFLGEIKVKMGPEEMDKIVVFR